MCRNSKWLSFIQCFRWSYCRTTPHPTYTKHLMRKTTTHLKAHTLKFNEWKEWGFGKHLLVALHTFSIIGSFSVQFHHYTKKKQKKHLICRVAPNQITYLRFRTSSIQQIHCAFLFYYHWQIQFPKMEDINLELPVAWPENWITSQHSTSTTLPSPVDLSVTGRVGVGGGDTKDKATSNKMWTLFLWKMYTIWGQRWLLNQYPSQDLLWS